MQFDAEFRRWSIKRNPETQQHTFDDFYSTIERYHKLNGIPFLISYIDPRDNDLLPINNDDNYHRALTIARPLLRIIVQKKGDSFEDTMGYGTMRPKNLISSLLGQTPVKSKTLAISNPHDFRQVGEKILQTKKFKLLHDESPSHSYIIYFIFFVFSIFHYYYFFSIGFANY